MLLPRRNFHLPHADFVTAHRTHAPPALGGIYQTTPRCAVISPLDAPVSPIATARATRPETAPSPPACADTSAPGTSAPRHLPAAFANPNRLRSASAVY